MCAVLGSTNCSSVHERFHDGPIVSGILAMRLGSRRETRYAARNCCTTAEPLAWTSAAVTPRRVPSAGGASGLLKSRQHGSTGKPGTGHHVVCARKDEAVLAPAEPQAEGVGVALPNAGVV
jgi:hypothetical protein